MAKANNKKTPKHCGFDAPAYGQMLGKDEKLVKQPNGTLKIVKNKK